MALENKSGGEMPQNHENNANKQEKLQNFQKFSHIEGKKNTGQDSVKDRTSLGIDTLKQSIAHHEIQEKKSKSHDKNTARSSQESERDDHITAYQIAGSNMSLQEENSLTGATIGGYESIKTLVQAPFWLIKDATRVKEYKDILSNESIRNV